MKKLCSILLVFALLLPAGAWACTEPLAVKAACNAGMTFDDPAWWPVTNDHTFPGILYPGEKLGREPVQHLDGCWIAGKMHNGWMREAVEIRTVTADGVIVAGLTLLCNTTITIYPEYTALAEAVVHELLGEGAELCQNTLVSGAIWWDGDYCSLISHPSWSDRFEIGYATLNNGEDVTPWYLGTFGGQLRFGLACGFREAETETHVWVDANVTAEAQAAAEAVAGAQASAQAAVIVNNSGAIDQSGDGCWRNNTVVQINVGLWQTVKNCIRWIKEGCEE